MSIEVCEVCGEVVFPRYCPHCGMLVDGATPVDDTHGHPQPEDISICLYCSGLSVYTQNGLRLPTDEEWKSAMAKSDVQRAVAALSYMRSKGQIPPCQR
jgi:hypothetical protein